MSSRLYLTAYSTCRTCACSLSGPLLRVFLDHTPLTCSVVHLQPQPFALHLHPRGHRLVCPSSEPAGTRPSFSRARAPSHNLQALVLDHNMLGRIAGGIGAFKQLQVTPSLYCSCHASALSFRNAAFIVRAQLHSRPAPRVFSLPLAYGAKHGLQRL